MTDGLEADFIEYERLREGIARRQRCGRENKHLKMAGGAGKGTLSSARRNPGCRIGEWGVFV